MAIRSIAIIPYKDWLLFSPSRFSFYKIDRKTGKEVSRVRSPIDSVIDIAIPVPTHRRKRDPHGPLLRKDPEISERLKLIFEVPYFIATGSTSSTNALIDWTTMAPMYYFSLSIYDAKGFNDQLYLVGSICFFGGIPQTQTYLLSPDFLSSDVEILRATHRHRLGVVILPEASKYKIMKWVNQTFYVYILQKELANRSPNRPRTFFMDHGPFMNLDHQFLLEEQYILQDEFDNLNMITFRFNPDLPILFPEKNLGRTDNLFLLASSISDSIVIRPNPLKSDIYCGKNILFSLKSYRARMLHGGFIDCLYGCRFPEFEVRLNHLDPEAEEVYINCAENMK